jgi:hypothetical protein
MAEQDPAELVVAGTGDIYVAPVGSTLPVDPEDALSASYVKLGYTNEDGLTLHRTPQVEEFMAWQSRSPVRRELVGQEIMLSFALEQWNSRNVTFAFGGGEVVDLGGGVHRYNFVDDDDQLEENTLVADFRDGDKHYRIVFPRGNVTEDTETNLVRSALAVLPVGFKALKPADEVTAYLLTDDPAFVAAS